MENIVLPRKFKNSENIVIKYVVIVHRGVRYEMNFICLTMESRWVLNATFLVRILKENGGRDRSQKNGRFRSNREGWNL